MKERYCKLFSLVPNLYADGSPLIVLAGNLLKDNVTGNVLAQLKIKNISPKAVKAATVLVHALDIAGRPMDEDATKEYLDLSVRQGEEFGQKVAIPLPNSSTRGFTVAVKEVVFEDNSAYEGTDAPLGAPARGDAPDPHAGGCGAGQAVSTPIWRPLRDHAPGTQGDLALYLRYMERRKRVLSLQERQGCPARS